MQGEVTKPRIKCYTCMRPSSTCVCKHISPLKTRTRFIILMHPKEYKKERNGTGLMTQLQLDNSEIIVGVDFSDNDRVNEILNNKEHSSVLLYPGKNNFNLSQRNGSEMNAFLGNSPFIFILDGTWPCARKMLKLSTNLQKLKRLSFNNSIESKFIFKQQPKSLCLSTIESVFTVLNLLKKGKVENCDTTDFLIPFEKMIAHQLDYMIHPNNTNDSSTIHYEISSKTLYKNEKSRKVVFELE